MPAFLRMYYGLRAEDLGHSAINAVGEIITPEDGFADTASRSLRQNLLSLTPCGSCPLIKICNPDFLITEYKNENTANSFLQFTLLTRVASILNYPLNALKSIANCVKLATPTVEADLTGGRDILETNIQYTEFSNGTKRALYPSHMFQTRQPKELSVYMHKI